MQISWIQKFDVAIVGNLTYIIYIYIRWVAIKLVYSK